MPRIVLASTSPYRRELLTRLRIAFDVIRPDVDEATLPGEAPRAKALRLAEAKARAVMRAAPFDALVIGSDQVAEIDGHDLGKPHIHTAALQQLQSMQGRTVLFHTALAVLNVANDRALVDCVPTEVRFRNLPTAALDAYLRQDTPYDCAGAAKIESLGIALVEAVTSDDPTALIGLPLIRLTSMLTACGVQIPQP